MLPFEKVVACSVAVINHRTVQMCPLFIFCLLEDVTGNRAMPKPNLYSHSAAST